MKTLLSEHQLEAEVPIRCEARPSLVIHTCQGSKSVTISDRLSAVGTRKRSPDTLVACHAWQNAIALQSTSAPLLYLGLQKTL